MFRVSGYPYPEVTWFYNGVKVELSNRRLSNGNDLMLIDFLRNKAHYVDYELIDVQNIRGLSNKGPNT